MKTINFNEDGSQKQTIMGLFEEVKESTEKLKEIINSPIFNWDRIDSEVDAVTDKEAIREGALDTDYHDCGLVGGGDGSCDNPIHENHD